MSSPARSTSGAERRRGSAVIVVLLGLALMLALAAAAGMLAASDLLAGARQRDARSARSAAEAALERAAAELADLPDWSPVLSGAVVSLHVDGPASTPRIPLGGQVLTPAEVANLATCGATIACSAAASATVTAERPWGPNNPRWQPFAHGPAGPGAPDRPGPYVVVLVGDDPAENDDDPTRDGLAPGNPGAGIVLLRAEAFGPSETRRAVEAAIARVTLASGMALPRILSWTEVR